MMFLIYSGFIAFALFAYWMTKEEDNE